MNQKLPYYSILLLLKLLIFHITMFPLEIHLIFRNKQWFFSFFFFHFSFFIKILFLGSIQKLPFLLNEMRTMINKEKIILKQILKIVFFILFFQ